MDIIRIKKLAGVLDEAPLDNYEFVDTVANDDKRLSSFDKDNLRMIKHPSYVKKLTNLLSKSGYNFNIMICHLNQDELRHLNPKKFKQTGKIDKYDLDEYMNFYSGEYTEEEIDQIFGLDIKPESNSITILEFGNTNAVHRLTPWILMHRFFHFIGDAINNDDQDYGYNAINHISVDTNNSFIRFEHFCKENFDSIFSTSTVKSVRDNNLSSEDEIINELLVQYVVSGKITLDYNRIKKDTKLALLSQDEIKKRENELNILAKLVLDSCVGKIFLGF